MVSSDTPAGRRLGGGVLSNLDSGDGGVDMGAGMQVIELLRQVRDGKDVSEEAVAALVAGIGSARVSEGQAAAFLMAVTLRGLSPSATTALTLAMRDSGTRLSWGDLAGRVVDKHSTGGVGDKVSLVLAPLAAACGLRVPMICGRSLGHTGGTVDKLESIAGVETRLSPAACRRQLQEVGAFISSQTETLAPADRRLYALRELTATVESIPLITASILGKKLCAGIGALVCDVKVGSGAFMREPRQAAELARSLAAVGAAVGLPVRCLLTAMDQPLGHAVGNALEVREAVAVLAGAGPADVVDLTVELVAHMLEASGSTATLAAGRSLARRRLADGQARARFTALVAAQGGDPRTVDDPDRLPCAPATTTLTAERGGFVAAIDGYQLGCAAVAMGAGRAQAGAVVDPAVGLVTARKVGDPIAAGEAWITVHHRAGDERWRPHLATALRLSDRQPPAAPLLVAP